MIRTAVSQGGIAGAAGVPLAVAYGAVMQLEEASRVAH
jgi:hypothetical protein